MGYFKLRVVANRILTNGTHPLWSPLGLGGEAVTPLIADITLAAPLYVQDAIDEFSKGLLLPGQLHTNEGGRTVTEPIAVPSIPHINCPGTSQSSRRSITSRLTSG